MTPPLRPLALALTCAALLSACAAPGPAAAPAPPPVPADVLAKYGPIQDGARLIPAVDPQLLSADKARQRVDYWSDEPPGTIVVDPWARRLYLVEGDNRAMRYTVAVGAAGRGFTGAAHIPYQRDWPSWRPTQNMVAENPELYGPVKDGLEGGLGNPLGARALYLHRGNRDTFYRIHGTMEPESIGEATSAGCIRLWNQDIIDLANRVTSGSRVVVLSRAEAGQGTVPPGQPRPALPQNPLQAEYLATQSSSQSTSHTNGAEQ